MSRMDDGAQSEITVEKLTDGSTWIRGPRDARIVLNRRTADVMRMQFGGYLLGEMMARTIVALDEAVDKARPFAIAIDADAQSGYEPQVRTLVTNWLLKRRDQLQPGHVLGAAPFVKMWMQMLNLSLGSKVFQLYEDRAEFDRNVGKVIRESERMRAARRS
jgi:hypothetical protein